MKHKKKVGIFIVTTAIYIIASGNCIPKSVIKVTGDFLGISQRVRVTDSISEKIIKNEIKNEIKNK